MKESRVLWLALLGIVVAACCCAVTVAGLLIARGVSWSSNWVALGRAQATGEFARTFPASGTAILELNIPLGDVTVQTGAAERVVVEASLRAWGRTRADAQALLDRITVRAEQDGQRVRVATTSLSELRQPAGVSRSPEIDLLIMVPPQTTLIADTEVGRLTVSGLRGDITIAAGVGEVSLRDVLPEHNLAIRSRVGNIELRGPLVDGAAYNLTSDVGRIALRLPRTSTFMIEARSDLGDVELGFPLEGRSARDFIGKEVRGQVGAAPTTTLILRSRVGTISVQPLP